MLSKLLERYPQLARRASDALRTSFLGGAMWGRARNVASLHRFRLVVRVMRVVGRVVLEVRLGRGSEVLAVGLGGGKVPKRLERRRIWRETWRRDARQGVAEVRRHAAVRLSKRDANSAQGVRTGRQERKEVGRGRGTEGAHRRPVARALSALKTRQAPPKRRSCPESRRGRGEKVIRSGLMKVGGR
jgi:hypothetical protein